MSQESRICRHCDELIELVGVYWIHSKTQERVCGRPIVAEPVERLGSVAFDQSAYHKGLSEGRRAAFLQERKSKQFTGPLSGVAKEILARAFETRLNDLKLLERTCESPIEELFALSCVFESGLTYDLSSGLWRNEDSSVRMAVQYEVGAYRVDFIFNDVLVVEIDGHDFHDRDQEQASSDRKRDRDLMAAGYFVVRFTGSDVYNAPIRCAFEVSELLKKNTRID